MISSSLKAVEGVKVFKTLEEFKNAYRDDERQVWIIGGASLYESALKDCDELIITRVKLSPDGDVFFPKFEDKFKETGKIFESPDFDIVKYTVK